MTLSSILMIKRFRNGLVVQTGIRGIVWNGQLSDYICRVVDSDKRRVEEIILSEEIDSQLLGTGLPIEGPDDERLEFQDSELNTLWTLTGDYNECIFDDDKPWLVDVDLLTPSMQYNAVRPHEVIAEAMHIIRTRWTGITMDDLEYLEHSGAFDASQWIIEGNDRLLSSQITLGISKLANFILPMNSLGSVKVSTRLPNARHLPIEPGSRIITAPFLWSDGGDELLALASGSNPTGGDGFEVMMLATHGESA